MIQCLRSFILFLVMILWLFSCQKLPDKQVVNTNVFSMNHPNFHSDLQYKIQKIYTDYQIQGDVVFAIVDSSGLAYSYIVNKDVLEKRPTKYNDESPLYIASHTKSFTGTLLKILEEQGEIDLNASVKKYLPELHLNDKIDLDRITVKQLLNHTHGLFNTQLAWKTAFLGYSGNNIELIEDFNNDFQYDSSHQFRYSNVGPILAAMIVEKVSGKSWKQCMQDEIFNPLQMRGTTTEVSDFEKNEIMPSYTIDGSNSIVNSGFFKDDITMHASGGVLSSVSDLSKWICANINQEKNLLTQESWNELHTSTTRQDRTYFTYHRNGYSLGWDVATYQNDTILTRFGGLAGISFHASFIPKKKVGIIAFSNDSRAYLLPHLLANYAYNYLFRPTHADSIFKKESALFQESFEKENEIRYPLQDNVLVVADSINPILGRYVNDKGWPDITLMTKDDHYIFKWGIQEGVVFMNGEAYQADLGVMQRDFLIENDSLFTGSLNYIKE